LSDQSSQDESDLPEQLFGRVGKVTINGKHYIIRRPIVVVAYGSEVACITLDDILREIEEELENEDD
jgi:hypothetical protein